MNKLNLMLASVMLTQCAPAYAGETILYEDAPAWADQVDLKSILAANASSNNFIVVLDRQIRQENGSEHSFADIAVRGHSAEFLPGIGQILRGNWQPDRGDLIIHRLEIIRAGEIINVLEKGKKFEVLRQEKGLDSQQVNGILTATTQIENLKVGDVVRFSFTVTSSNPVLAGRTEAFSALAAQQIEADFDRIRLLWPSKDAVKFKVFGKDVKFSEAVKDGYSIVTLGAFVPEQPKLPKDTPNRYAISPAIMTSGFSTWSEVSKIAALQYQTNGLVQPGSELEGEISKIKSKTQVPLERTALALQLVQDKIRYLYNGLGYGNYKPQSPQETWQLRYGDCKAKTLLLLSILNELDISAQPILVSVSRQDAVVSLLPSFQAFDHIIVKATVDGQTLWLDGTASGTRISDLKDAPPHRYGLPLSLEGSDLQPIEINKPGRPFQKIDLTYDASAGLALPALFDVELRLRDEDATKLRAEQSQGTSEAFKKALNVVAAKYVVDAVVTESSFVFDEIQNEAIIKAKGLSYLDWTKKEGRFELSAWSVIDGKKFEPDRKKPEWRIIPIDVAEAGFYSESTKVKLPGGGTGFTLDGKNALAETVIGRQLERTSDITNDVFNFREDYFLKQYEIKPEEIPTETRKLSRLQKDAVKILAPLGHPDKWQQVRAAQSSKKIDLFKKALDKAVANNPEKDEPYRQRAVFFHLIGDYSQAAKDLAQAIKIEPTADILSWRAGLLRITDENAAIDVFKEAIKLEPTHDDSISELIDIYSFAKKPDMASKVLEDAFAAGLEDEAAEIYRAHISLSSGKTEDAISKMDVLIKDKPNDAYLLGTRCWIKALGNIQLDTALDDCTKSIQLSESPAGTLNSRGLVHFRLGDFDAAIADFDEALEISPDFAAALYQRSLANVKKGNTEASKNDLEAAVFAIKDVARVFNFYGVKP